VLRARTSTELLRFAELLEVPIIAAWRRADVISNDHALYLGMAGYGAAPTVQARLDAADALVVIGSRLNQATTFGYAMPRDGLPWAHLDLVPGEASGSTAPMIRVATDAKAFLKAANERLLGKAVLDAALVAIRQANNRDDRAAFEAASVVDATPWDGPGVHPGRTITTLRRLLPDDAILTTDAGNFASWAGRGFRFRRPGTFLGPTSGAMGYGLPAAIADLEQRIERTLLRLAQRFGKRLLERDHHPRMVAVRAAQRLGDDLVDESERLEARPGFAAMLERIEGNGVRTIIVETANRFARDLMVQEVGFARLKSRGVTLIAADSPAAFVEDTPTARLVRQVLGAIAEFDKAMTVAKLKGARDRIRRERGKCEGRKPLAETHPVAVALAKRLHRASPKNGARRSLRKIAAELAAVGHKAESGMPFNPRTIKAMVEGPAPKVV
jgi:DNA invertase Pin-like site-specific DNA recombinase